MENKTLNQKTLMVLAPLLVLTGIAGFLIPEQYTMMSGAAPYNMFHLVFGALGLVLISANNDLFASSFNFGFGLIDLYQVLASAVGLTPIEYFHWTYVDDVVHVVLGFALALIGGYGLWKWKTEYRRATS
jgi:multisubunit Na+/H+ antiporter MnhG subunit